MSLDKTLLEVSAGGLDLETPVIISSGVWPYESSMWTEKVLRGVGAVCTKAVSLRPRMGNEGNRVWETPSGMLNSIGLQNTGVDSFLEDYLPSLAAAETPFIVNVAAESGKDTAETLLKLEEHREQIPCVELNISCPNVDCDGMSWGMHPDDARTMVRIARRCWRGSLWVKMTPQAPDIAAVSRAVRDAGADALVASNTWLGMEIDIEKGKPVFQRNVAGLSGPAIFPLALRVVWELCRAVDIPVIGCGGVADYRSCIAMIMAGASAVEVGTAMFMDLHTPERICRDMEKFLASREYSNISQVRGIAGR